MRLRLFAPIAVLVATGAVFLPSLRFSFLPWDDTVILNANPLFRGDGSSGFSWILTTRVLGHWVPLTWLSFAADYAVWGRNPTGYHLTNLLLHALNGLLWYAVARRLLAQAWRDAQRPALEAGALIAALAFAVHPLRVESVVWVTERRDVLSGTLFLLTVLAYLRAVEQAGPADRRWMALSWLAFAGSLLAKQITVTIPAVLMILDVYPLRRARAPRTLREKIPFAVLAAGGATIAVLGQAGDIGFTPLRSLGVVERLALVTHSLVFYPLQTLVPLEVSPLHELPARIDPLAPRFLASMIVVAAVTGIAVAVWRAAPWVGAAWAYSVVMILPVSGVAHVSTILGADRYSYLSTLGWALVLGGALTALIEGRQRRAMVLAGLAAVAVLVGGWAHLTRSYLTVWGDPERLWRHAIGVDPECAQCRGHLGVALLAQGRLADAERECTLAVLLRPDRADHHAFLASVLERQEHTDEAARSWAAAALLHPRYDVEARRALGVALARHGRFDEAVDELRAAYVRKADPRVTAELIRTLNDIAIARARGGRLDLAEQALVEALTVGPDNTLVRENLAAVRDARALRTREETASDGSRWGVSGGAAVAPPDVD